MVFNGENVDTRARDGDNMTSIEGFNTDDPPVGVIAEEEEDDRTSRWNKRLFTLSC